MRYVQAARDAGLRRAVVSSSAQLPRRARRRRDRGPLRGVDRRRGRRARAPAGQARARHLPRGRPRRSASSRPRPPCSRTRSPASRPGRAGGFGCVVGVDRVGQADALREHGADVVVDDLAELLGGRDDRAPLLRASSPGRSARPSLDLDVLAQSESVFALVERPHRPARQPRRGRAARPARHLPQRLLRDAARCRTPRRATAIPEAGQTLINVTNGKIIRLLVDDEPFDVRYGELRAPRARARPARRRPAPRGASGVSPAGQAVRDPLDAAGLVRPAGDRGDRLRGRAARRAGARSSCSPSWSPTSRCPTPRRRPAGRRRAAAPRCSSRTSRARRPAGRARAPHPRQRAADGGGDGPRGRRPGRDRTTTPESERRPRPGDRHRPSSSPAQRLRLVKFLAYGWSSERSLPAVRDQVEAALAGARHTGWDGLVDDQREYLDDFWERADVEIEGDAELQQAVRFALFHVLQAGARAEQRAIPAKGLTGPRLRRAHLLGHRDLRPAGADLHRARRGPRRAALAALDPRPRRASARAQLGLEGAAFPWRTIRGEECSGYWPAGTAAFHVNADIADAVVRYLRRDRRRRVRARRRARAARRDRAAVALARPPRRPGPLPHRRRHRAGRVQRDRRQQRLHEPDGRSGTCAPPPTPPSATRDRAAELGVDAEEAAAWRDAAEAMVVPYDEALGVHPQSEGFTEPPRAGTSPAPRPTSTRCCCTSPTSTSTASRSSSRPTWCWPCYLRGDAFTREQKARNFAYYEALTVRDSSLSACTQAVIAAEVGHLELAYDYFAEAALLDLDDLEHNTRDGLHIASLAGAWIAAVGGLRRHARPRRLAELRAAAAAARSAGSPSGSRSRPPARGRGRPRPGRATARSRASRSRSPTTATR